MLFTCGMSAVRKINTGDLVGCYILNTDLVRPKLLQVGIVLDVSGDNIFVLDQEGGTRWWREKRWKILSKRSP